MAGVPGPHRSSQEWAVDRGVGQHRPPQNRDGFRVLLTTQASVTIPLFKDRGRLIADYTFLVTRKEIHFVRTQGHKK